ncbi:hypothetical protein ACFCWX_42985, partial [Streptomyces sp. NPDC056405]
IVHWVRGADGKWAPPIDANGTAVKAPDRGESTGSSSLAVHDGKLHLLRSTMLDRLWHAVFDGTSWSEGTLLPESHVSPHAPALASYDGKLHAVYTTPESRLRHTTWTAADGWADAQDMEDRESQELPALLAFKDGPAGAEREALLL